MSYPATGLESAPNNAYSSFDAVPSLLASDLGFTSWLQSKGPSHMLPFLMHPFGISWLS